MSMKNTKNLLIIAAVLVGLLAGTVLLGNYTNILSTRSDTDSQPKACQAKASAYCPVANALTGENANMMSAQTAEETEKGCCPKTDCPPDCTKPCCAGDAKPACCPNSNASAAATGCCPATVATTE